MKALNQTEIEIIADWVMDELKGAQLQEVYSFEDGIVLGFYLQRLRYLIFDLHPLYPFFFIFDEPPFRKGKMKKPLELFLSSHGKNRRLEKVTMKQSYGRVVEFFFSGSGKLELRFEAVPRQVNLMAQTDKSSVSWNKPKELQVVSQMDGLSVRSLSQLKTEWQNWRWMPKSSSIGKATPLVDKNQQILNKKEKACEQIQLQLDSDETMKWAEVGELLKSKALTELSADWDLYLDRLRSRSWNMDRAFSRAKQLQKKRMGLKKRLDILRSEIELLKTKTGIDGADEFNFKEKSSQGVRVSAKKQPGKYRTLELSKGKIAHMGKSAEENLRLLRSAKAWDLWLHLRDYPGSHLIIHRDKTEIVSEQDLALAGRWLAEQSLSKKILMSGAKVEVLVAECRFVKPIRGDQKGRVNYQNARKLFVKI